MTIEAISSERTVPVQEDLTTEDLSLQVIRGLETMFRADKPFASGVSLVDGEWGVLQSDGTVARASSTPVPNTYPVFCGTNRFDSHATGQVTLILGGGPVLKTNRFDDGQSYAPGDFLTVKDLGGGESSVTKQAGSDPRLGKVIEVGADYLVFELLAGSGQA